jgi:nucleoside 2-deoxyribosyltransferase
MKSIYLIGSLRNPKIIELAQAIRGIGFDVFDDFMAAGKDADDNWRDYEKARGHSYAEALNGYAAKHVFAFDLKHLTRCDIAVLLMPAGKSGHLELGWALGKGKPGFILFDEEPARFDVMYQFCNAVLFNEQDLLDELKKLL